MNHKMDYNESINFFSVFVVLSHFVAELSKAPPEQKRRNLMELAEWKKKHPLKNDVFLTLFKTTFHF